MSTVGAPAIKHLVVNPAEASAFLAFMLGWAGGEIPVFVDGRQVPDFTIPCDSEAGSTLWRRAKLLDERRNCQVEVGLPWRNGAPGSSTVLWAWVKGPDQLFRASRFRPEPAMVLRFGAGSERLLIWGLKESIGWPLIEPHNAKISYALHGARTRCEAERLRVPVPGTFLRVGKTKPLPVMLTRMELTGYARSQVTATLKDPPSRDAWRERKR